MGVVSKYKPYQYAEGKEALGNYVVVKYSNHPQYGTFKVYYAHLSSVGVRVGNRVGRGMVLGYSGRSGNLGTEKYGTNGKVTGYHKKNKKLTPHVHIQVFKDGKWIDPGVVLPDYASDKFDMRTGKLKEQQKKCQEVKGGGYKVVLPGRLFPELNFDEELSRLRALEGIVGIVGEEDLNRLRESLSNVGE